jgi:hypothetical protein
LTGFGYDQKEEIADVHLLVMFLFHINNGKVTVSGVVTAVDVDVAVTWGLTRWRVCGDATHYDTSAHATSEPIFNLELCSFVAVTIGSDGNIARSKLPAGGNERREAAGSGQA